MPGPTDTQYLTKRVKEVRRAAVDGHDSTNTIFALALGLLIVFLVMAGTLFIMGNLNHNMMPMDQVLRTQR